MGVTGLWRLIDASGKPVPLETLEGKVLAIDISIWIHQVLQGYQDRRGNAVPNAHLLGLYSRICKLLYFKIKPVFVFDGGVPLLKKNTIIARKKHKAVAAGKAEQMKNDLLHNLMKHSLVKGVLARKTGDGVESSTSSSQKDSRHVNDMYRLPSLPSYSADDHDSYESDSSIELSPRKQTKYTGNIHTVDVSTADFKALPADVRYDILTDLKETRKQNSWGRLHEMPQETHQFSNYQMQRLLKRRKVQESLETAEQEMGGKNLTLDELEKLMTDQGVDIHGRDAAFRIAADSTTRLIYINDLKALKSRTETSDPDRRDINEPSCSSEKEFHEILPTIAEESGTVMGDIHEYELDDDWDSDIEIIDRPVDVQSVKKFFGSTKLNPALSYMIEYSGLSQEQILSLIQQSRENIRVSNKNEKKPKRTCLDFDDEPTKKRVKKTSESSAEVTVALPAIKGEPQSPPTEKQSVLSSDSESDGFVEVPDVPVPNVSVKNKIEITVKPEDKLDDEDDIFADIFDHDSLVGNITLSDSSINDQSNRSLTVEPSKEVQVEAAINNKSTLIPGAAEIDSSMNEKIVTDLIAREENISDKDQQESVKSEEKSSHTIVEDNLEIPLKENFELNQKQLPHHISNTTSATVPTLAEEDRIAEHKISAQSPTKTLAPIFDRGMSDKVRNIISRLNNDKEEILSNVNKSEELLNMKSQLENENQELKEHVGKLERQATEVTEQMRSEAQDLLRLFGIPYVVAPQEAEAQCAYLEMINLTDGTITDDSDIWLFGGRCVYKNFFNNAKRVMEYRSKDIEHHFKLTREQMIQLALLVGSDYTVGINGIGPVTGLEVLASFPADSNDLLKGLMKFSAWIKAGRQAGPGRTTLRNKLRNIVVDQGFPSQAVVQAYLFPTVDESKEIFTWGKPNLVLLSDYTKEKFGWTKSKFEETMGPVMSRLSDTKTQKNIMSYFKIQTVPHSIDQNLSKRVQKAVKKMDRQGANVENDSDEIEEMLENAKQEEIKKPKKIRKKKGELDDDEGGEHEKNSMTVGKNKEEYIPQREKERAAALKKKLQAIEVFRKSRKGPGKSGKKNVRPARKAVRKEANLSESSSDTD